MGGILVLFATLLCSVCLSVVQGIELPGLSTNRPRMVKPKYTLKPTVSATALPSTTSLYRINATTGTTCILIRTDALLSITYRHKLEGDVEADLYLPDYPELSGDCSDPDSESLTMSFKGFTINMYFKKTPGGEQWYLSNMELTFSSSNYLFEDIPTPYFDVKLTTPSSMMFSTPLGKSYTCDSEQEILMKPLTNYKSGFVAKLYFRYLQIQSFIKESDKFGPPFLCSATTPLTFNTTVIKKKKSFS